MGLLISAVGFSVNGLVQHMFYLKNIEWLFWILLGAASLLFGSHGHRRLDRVAHVLVIASVLALPWRVFGLEAIPGPGDRSFGFHELEASAGGSLQWSTGHAAKWLNWEDEILIVKLANGHPRASEHPVEVVIRIDGREQFRGTLRGGWEERRFELGPSRSEGVVVEWKIHPTFRPFVEFRNYPDLTPSIDPRSLGIEVGEIRWESADSLDRP